MENNGGNTHFIQNDNEFEENSISKSPMNGKHLPSSKSTKYLFNNEEDTYTSSVTQQLDSENY
jgi:hypothetical protein